MMCFSDGKVELLDPPSDSKPGEYVFVEGYERETAGGKCTIVLYSEHRSGYALCYENPVWPEIFEGSNFCGFRSRLANNKK